MKDNRSPTEAVLAAVADREGVPPTGLEDQLYDAVDPEALDETLSSCSGSLTFEYCGYEVTVSDGPTVDLSTARAD